MTNRINYRRLSKLAGSLSENAMELAVLIETEQPHGQYYAAVCAELDSTLHRICSMRGIEIIDVPDTLTGRLRLSVALEAAKAMAERKPVEV